MSCSVCNSGGNLLFQGGCKEHPWSICCKACLDRHFDYSRVVTRCFVPECTRDIVTRPKPLLCVNCKGCNSKTTLTGKVTATTCGCKNPSIPWLCEKCYTEKNLTCSHCLFLLTSKSTFWICPACGCTLASEAEMNIHTPSCVART